MRQSLIPAARKMLLLTRDLKQWMKLAGIMPQVLMRLDGDEMWAKRVFNPYTVFV